MSFDEVPQLLRRLAVGKFDVAIRGRLLGSQRVKTAGGGEGKRLWHLNLLNSMSHVPCPFIPSA